MKNTDSKISPAFEPFLAESGPNVKRDAIVLYSTPPNEALRAKGRLREVKARLDLVKERTAAQQEVEERIFERYLEAGSKQMLGQEKPDVSSIGGSALPLARVEVTRKTLAALAQQPEVVAVLPDQKIRLIQPQEVDYTELRTQERNEGHTWGLTQLKIPEMWQHTRGAGINVAVLDTGVYGDHEALAGRVKDFVFVDPLGRRLSTQPTFDGGRHGTHVCGTIAGGKTADGVAIGVAPEADLLVAAVLVGETTLQTLLEGMSWAVERGANIISMSLGFNYYEPLFAAVLDVLLQQYGILPVIAIGNESHGNICSPGSAYSALAVGAVEKLRGSKVDVAFFSGGASLVFPGEKIALVTKPDVVAPGVQVYSCIPTEKRPDGIFEYTYMDGTSMATPHVAGVAALLMAAKPEATAADIMRALKETAAHPLGADRRPDNRWGYGLIQPLEALKALQV